MQHPIHNFSQMATGFYTMIAGAVGWIGVSIASLINPPDSAWMIWLDKYGFPTVVSILLFVGIVIMFKAYCGARDATGKVQEARIADRDGMIEQYKVDFTDAQTSRVQMVETNKQTVDMLCQVKEELQMIRGLRVYQKRKPTMNNPSDPQPETHPTQ